MILQVNNRQYLFLLPCKNKSVRQNLLQYKETGMQVHSIGLSNIRNIPLHARYENILGAGEHFSLTFEVAISTTKLCRCYFESVEQRTGAGGRCSKIRRMPIYTNTKYNSYFLRRQTQNTQVPTDRLANLYISGA